MQLNKYNLGDVVMLQGTITSISIEDEGGIHYCIKLEELNPNEFPNTVYTREDCIRTVF